MNDYEQNPGQLADLLDASLPPHTAETHPFNGSDLVQAASRLADASHPTLSPEAMARIQGKVIQAARQQQAQRRIMRLNTPLLRWAAVFVLVFLGFSAAVPSVAGSLPGEPFYTVKRSLENVELFLAASPSAKASTYLDQAERRLHESQTLLERSQFSYQLIQDAHDDISQSLQQSPADTYTLVETRAAQLRMNANGIVQAAVAAGLTQPEDVVDLLPEATVTPTIAPTATLTATIQPSATPSATATSTPVPTMTALPTLTPTDQPTSVPVIVPTDPPAMPTAVSTPFVEILPTPDTGFVISDSSVNVRKGPGTEFEVIAVLPPGTPILLIGKSDSSDWQHVRLSDGRAGWILASLVSNNPPVSSNGGQPNSSCDHPGNYCNAPGQEKNDIPGDNGTNPGQDKDNPGKKDHPPGLDNNQGQDSPPNNPGPPPDKPPKEKNK